MYLRDGDVTAIVLTGGYYYCSYTFFFIYTSILIPRGGEGWGVVLQIARQSGRHDDTRWGEWRVVDQMEWRARYASNRSRCSPPERKLTELPCGNK